MADNQQNGSQQFEIIDGQLQLNGTADSSSTNNDSGQFECVRDDDRSGKCASHLSLCKIAVSPVSDTRLAHADGTGLTEMS